MQVIEQESVKGFPEVVVGTNVSDCISHVIQVDVTSIPESLRKISRYLVREFSFCLCTLDTN